MKPCTAITAVVVLQLTLQISWAHSQPPTHLWSQRFGSTSYDEGWSVATDTSGNVLVTGFFSGTVDFGGGNLVSAGAEDIFLAKYDASGNHLWSRRFGSTASDHGRSVAVDGSGNVFVTGLFQGTVDFGGGILTGAGQPDIFIAKYDANGNHLWSRRFGSGNEDVGWSVVADDSGNVFVTGYFSGTVDFGGGNLVSAGLWDIFLAKYDASGNHLWSRRFGSAAYEYAYSVAVDGSGNVFVTGYFSGTVDFGGGNLVSAGGWDIFLAKYDASGNHLWSQHFGSTDDDEGYSVAVDGSENVFATGYFSGTVDFGGGDLVSAGGTDIFLAKYDASGAHLWSQRLGGTSYEYNVAVAVDTLDNVFLTGEFWGTADFGGGNLVSAGGTDIILAGYDASGAHLWSQRFGGSDDDTGWSVAADNSGNLFVTGKFEGTANFGGGNLVSAGIRDIFLAEYDSGVFPVCDVQPSSIDFCGVPVGDAVDRSFTIANVGGGTLDGDVSETCDHYSILSGSGPFSLGAGDSVVVTARFAPTTLGVHACTVETGAGLCSGVSLIGAGRPDPPRFVEDFETGTLGCWSFHYATNGQQNGSLDPGDWLAEVTSSALEGSYSTRLYARSDHSSSPWNVRAAIDTSTEFLSTLRFKVKLDAIQGTGGNGGSYFQVGVINSDNTEQHVWYGFSTTGDQGGDFEYAVNPGDELDFSRDVGQDLRDKYAMGVPERATLVFRAYADYAEYGGGTRTTDVRIDQIEFTYPFYALIDSVTDVPDDQGGWARVHFSRSIFDDANEDSIPVAAYAIHRRIDNPATVATILEQGEHLKGEDDRTVTKDDMGMIVAANADASWIRLGDRYFHKRMDAAAPQGFWEVLGTVPAQQQDRYIYLAPTLADSSDTLEHTVYYISTHTTTPSIFFDSPPDSGYSVDNIAPGVPEGFAAAYNTGNGNTITWDPVPDNDLQYYSVYRGTETDFEPSPDCLVDMTTATAWSDPEYDGWQVFYKVTAVDHAGNESDPAGSEPYTGVEDEPAVPKRFTLYQNVPNPFNPTTLIRYDVPAGGGHVTLRVYDVGGRLVRTLVDQAQTSGLKRVIWRATNDTGESVASGIYFYRLTAPGFDVTRKMVLLQ
jgi:hypothetical protein